MKDDPIARLIKESQLETSGAFTEATLAKLDNKLHRRMKLRLYLLIAAIVLLCAIAVYFLFSTGFQVAFFGLTLNMPKIFTMLTISLVCYFTVLHVLSLLKLEASGVKVS